LHYFSLDSEPEKRSLRKRQETGLIPGPLSDTVTDTDTLFADPNPKEELFSLVNNVPQVPPQAAATSIMANIAEGFIRRSSKEFVQFLFIAVSSVAEVQSHLYVALDQGYVPQAEFELLYEQANKTARIISGLITYLRTRSTSRTR
jgi:four helix bundle protein